MVWGWVLGLVVGVGVGWVWLSIKQAGVFNQSAGDIQGKNSRMACVFALRSSVPFCLAWLLSGVGSAVCCVCCVCGVCVKCV
jgi:hypothetical protein